MAIVIPNRLMPLGRKGLPITAKSYIRDGLVAIWDGIENAGWGTHTDTLPVKYGMSNLCNLVSPTISDGTVSYDFGLNVYGMTVESDGLSWSDTSAWAAWGRNFNTSQIPSRGQATSIDNAVACLSRAFPAPVGGQELTIEIVARLDTSGSPKQTVIMAGYNERAIYACYTSSYRNALVRWYRDGAQKFEYFQSPFASGRAQTISLVQSPDGVNRVYVDGAAVLEKTGPSGMFLHDMVSFLMVNDVRHPWSPSGKFHCLRAFNRALTPDEIAYNYEIDKARFNLPTT